MKAERPEVFIEVSGYRIRLVESDWSIVDIVECRCNYIVNRGVVYWKGNVS